MHSVHSTDNEILEIVDADDNVLGTATRAEIHRKNLIHRAVHLFVFNSHGDVYVQRRSASKDRHPRKLDSSAAGHVDPGESYERTAIRELEEELSITAGVTEVLRVRPCPMTDNEHVVLFTVFTDSEPVPNPDEVEWGTFISPVRLGNLMDSEPWDFVPAFLLLWKEYFDKGVCPPKETPTEHGSE